MKCSISLKGLSIYICLAEKRFIVLSMSVLD